MVASTESELALLPELHARKSGGCSDLPYMTDEPAYGTNEWLDWAAMQVWREYHPEGMEFAYTDGQRRRIGGLFAKQLLPQDEAGPARAA